MTALSARDAGRGTRPTAARDAPPPRALATGSSLLGNLLEEPTAGPAAQPARPRPAPQGGGGSRRWPLGYVQRGARDPRFDLLRGLCLVVMVVNHLGGDSWLYALTGGGTFYISAAEGFIFIAGYVLGLIAIREPLGVAVRGLAARAWLLYRLAVGITLGFSILAVLGRIELWYPISEYVAETYAGRPDAYLIGTLTLSTAYHGAEFLVLYVLLLLAAPLALLACAEGKGWLVPLVSAGLYLGVQLYPDQFRLPFATYLSLEAWQLLFFVGLALGYHRAWLAERIARWRTAWWLYAATVTVAALALLVLYRQNLTPVALFDRAHVEAVRAALTPRRLLLVALYLQFFFFLASWFWVPLRAACGWFFLSLGRNSLWIYALHLPLIVLFRNSSFLAGLDRTGGTLAQLGALVFLWGSIRLRDWANGSAYRAALPAPRPFRSLAQR